MPARPLIVLVQPRIPQNVGAIGRLCVANDAELAVVRPMPFVISDANVRRAGLDYWKHLTLHDHGDWPACRESLEGRRLWFLTRFATRTIYEVTFRPDDVLVFGSEPDGLPPEVEEEIGDRGLRIPMEGTHARSLNLSQSAAITLYELLRQTRNYGAANRESGFGNREP